MFLNADYIAHRREKDGEIQSLIDHLQEVSRKTGEFASKVGLKEQGEVIGLLHDIGKIGISDRILKSPEKYTRADWEEMKQHVYIGATLLKSLGFAEVIVKAAQYHHERFDGGGYLGS